jgi:hypothetical protein
MHQEKLGVIKTTKLALDEKDISHAQAIVDVKKQSAAIIDTKKHEIRVLKSDVKDYQDRHLKLQRSMTLLPRE